MCFRMRVWLKGGYPDASIDPPPPTPPSLSFPHHVCPFRIFLFECDGDTWQADSRLPAGAPRHVVCASRLHLPRLLQHGGAWGIPVRYRHTCGGWHAGAIRVGIGYGRASRKAYGQIRIQTREGVDGVGRIEGLIVAKSRHKKCGDDVTKVDGGDAIVSRKQKSFVVDSD